jgi:cellulose synthase/poly-beta-1,6-N-acetylglucosamine synthase-like glycosyltransferase
VEILYGLILGLEFVLLVPVGYLLILMLAALWPHKALVYPERPRTRFAVLIPAHNEEQWLPDTLAALKVQNYPAALYRVFVIADNCSDHTLVLARSAGVVVYERHNSVQIGKGYALNTLIGHLEAEKKRQGNFDAFLVVDADTILAPNFLQIMDAYFQQGVQAVQGYYTVRTVDNSWAAALRYVALVVLHYLRPLGRKRLGGSAGLKGNGMAFTAEVIRRFSWSGSVTEDIEYHMALLLAGERVCFAPEARLEAVMPASLKGARAQNVRWEAGRLQMAGRYVKLLWAEAMRHPRFALWDAVIEHLIPPTSILVTLVLLVSGLGIVVGLLQGGWLAAWIGGGLFSGITLYLLAGLILVRAPFSVWKALVYVPVFLAWKVGLYLRILGGREKQGWIRTER